MNRNLFRPARSLTLVGLALLIVLGLVLIKNVPDSRPEAGNTTLEKRSLVLNPAPDPDLDHKEGRAALLLEMLSQKHR